MLHIARTASLLIALALTIGANAMFAPLGTARMQGITSTPSLEASTPTATPSPAAILSPGGGQAVQGSMPVTGHTAVDEFVSAELSFAYHGSPTGTWFLIVKNNEPVYNDRLALWDTTTLTDGVYDLRLIVRLGDGTTVTSLVEGVRVRNYTAIETSTATPITPTATLVPGDTPVPTNTSTPTITPIPPTGTPLPPNPAQLSLQQVVIQTGKGALIPAGVFALGGILLLVSAIRNKKQE